MKRKILFIGPLPDPKGGVSIHIFRLGDMISPFADVRYIDESSVRKEEYFNVRSLRLFAYIKLILWADIVHIHSAINVFRILHICISKLLFKKVVITLHYTPVNQNLFFLRSLLNLCDKVVLVNKEAVAMLHLKKKPYVKEAFIPPSAKEDKVLPVSAENWIRDKKEKGYFIISANAWHLDIINNVDLYGLDMCVSAIKEFKNRLQKKVALVFTISYVTDSDTYYFDTIKHIKELEVEDEVLITTENVSFIKVIELSDIVLRPTNIDGDALTVRESLYLGVPVIASDVVARPEGTILFETRSQRDFFEKLDTTLGNIERIKESLSYPLTENYISFYKNLYEI
ncbi:MAG TPA: glycosyltransferase [Bacteroidales bacterium]|nr:glycosyltransferase [Bacteroidales bacterium]HPT20312.1 glycosyltransferase [Bacteroidales bacterium]